MYSYVLRMAPTYQKLRMMRNGQAMEKGGSLVCCAVRCAAILEAKGGRDKDKDNDPVPVPQRGEGSGGQGLL